MNQHGRRLVTYISGIHGYNFFEELEVQLPDSWIDTGLLPLVHKIKIDPNLLYELPPSKVKKIILL